MKAPKPKPRPIERVEKFTTEPQTPKLKRTLGFWQASICGIGIILGAGIYALVGVAAGQAGPALWISFLIAGIISLFTGLSYAELSTIFPKNAAEYDYATKAFHKHLGLVIAIMMIFAAIFTSATVALGFGGYFNGLTGTNVILMAIVLVLFLTFINVLGIKQSAWINTVLTIIEAAGLFLIIFIGMPKWGSVNLLEMPNGMHGILTAGALVFFSYIGFEAIVKLNEETKSPTKNIPRAIIFSVIVSTLVYILVAVSAVSVMRWQDLAVSTSPLADVAMTGLGPATFILLGLIALCSTTNTVLMDLVTTSRMTYGMAGQNALPSFLGKVHHRFRTPHYSILLVSLITILFILIEDIERVASLANFFTFMTFGLVNVATIVLRKTYPKRRAFKVPGQVFGIPIIPLLGAVTSFGMLYYVFSGII